MRIVSLVPSGTEMLYVLGLGEQLVGISHECDYPAEVRLLPSVTKSRIAPSAGSQEIDALVREQDATPQSLYELNVSRLAELKPDLVITQSICEVCAVSVNEVEQSLDQLVLRPEIVNLQPRRFEDVFRGLEQIARAAGVPQNGARAVAAMRGRVDRIVQAAKQRHTRKGIVVLEWLDPPFSAGHWNPELVRLAGGHELLGEEGQRSMQVSWEQVREADPEILLVACCGFNVARSRQDLHVLTEQPELRSMRCFQLGQVYLADGSQFFNRPGPRLVDSLELLGHLLDPEKNLLSSEQQAAVEKVTNA